MTLRSLRLPVSILLLLGLATVALWFHQGLAAEGGPAAKDADLSDPLRDDTENRVVLRVGGTRPIVERDVAPPTAPEPRRAPAPQPEARRNETQEPQRVPEPREPTFDTRVLGASETIYALVVRHYGNARRLGEVLRFNQLDEQSARSVPVGTPIRLPR